VTEFQPSAPPPSAGGEFPHQVQVAAGWLARNRDAVSGPIIPALRSKFGLTIMEAIDAAKLAHSLQRVGVTE